MKSFPNDSFQSGNNNCLNVKRSRVVYGRVSLATGKWKIVVIYVNIYVGNNMESFSRLYDKFEVYFYEFLPFYKM